MCVAGTTDGHETKGHHETKSKARVHCAHTRQHNNLCRVGGKASADRLKGGEPHVIKHPIDLRPPLAVSHAVTGDTLALGVDFRRGKLMLWYAAWALVSGAWVESEVAKDRQTSHAGSNCFGTSETL